MAKRRMRLLVFLISASCLYSTQNHITFAQESEPKPKQCDGMAEENRKLAIALADATSRILEMKDNSQTCPGPDGEDTHNKDETIVGLKETIRQLQAQNKHLSSAGTMGKTITNQVIALQERIDDLNSQLDKEKKNTAAFRKKVQEYEQQMQKEMMDHCVLQEEDRIKEMQAERQELSREITSLKLQQQELEARLELMQQKGGL